MRCSTDEGIGHLRIASTVEGVGLNCKIVRDTTAIGAEGMPARKLLVALSRDTVEAEVVSGRIWRISGGFAAASDSGFAGRRHAHQPASVVSGSRTG